MENISLEKTKIYIEEAKNLLELIPTEKSVFLKQNAVITNGVEGILSLLVASGVNNLSNIHREAVNLPTVAESVSHLNEDYFDKLLDGIPENYSEKDEQAVRVEINSLIRSLTI